MWLFIDALQCSCGMQLSDITNVYEFVSGQF